MDFTTAATGYYFLEAPRDDGHSIWFSDAVAGLYRLHRDGRIDGFLAERSRIGGVAIDESGAVIVSGAGGLAWLDPATGSSGILLDQIDGKAIGAINDMLPDGRGGLWFGTSNVESVDPTGPPQTTQLYRLDPDGRLALLWKGLHVANGIGVSPDGKRLYVNESWLGTYGYDLRPDGRLENRTLLSNRPDCDGLAVDRDGGIWIACFESGIILRLLPDGSRTEIRVPARHVTSLCFGGEDGCDLIVATGGDHGLGALLGGQMPPPTASLFRARAGTAGVAVPQTRFPLSYSSASPP